MPEFSGRTLPVDTAVVQRCARLQTPDERGERDALIAATALDALWHELGFDGAPWSMGCWITARLKVF